MAETAYGREADLSTYVSLVDAFREIQARTTGDGPYLVSNKLGGAGDWFGGFLMFGL